MSSKLCEKCKQNTCLCRAVSELKRHLPLARQVYIERKYELVPEYSMHGFSFDNEDLLKLTESLSDFRNVLGFSSSSSMHILSLGSVQFIEFKIGVALAYTRWFYHSDKVK